MQWRQCPSLIDVNVSLGVNTFMGMGCENTEQNQLDQLGQRNARGILPFDSSVKGHTALLGWNHGDQPDGHGTTPSSVKSRYEAMHSTDPSHLTFLTVTGGFFSQ
jgi:hypothetical protein